MKNTIKGHLYLLTPTAKTIAPIQINYDDGEDAANSVEINLIYNGTLYQGNGTDYLWLDAFADLQNKLPQNVNLACCMTCRHGNMCPYGNTKNELFCVKDLIVASKEDLINLFCHTDPFTERAVSAIDYCDDFIYQSDDCYTYNDYLRHLKPNSESNP